MRNPFCIEIDSIVLIEIQLELIDLLCNKTLQ